VTGFLALLGLTRAGFTAPSFAIFTDLLTGWVCAPGRPTITAMIAVADPAGRRAHDAYHRFVRDGAWSMNRLWQVLATHLVTRFYPTGPVELACDDTLFHHEGSKVEGAGIFRDAVRSTLRKVVYARGLNLVVITLQVRPPWGGCPVAVPVNVRVHKKHDVTTTIAHAAAMITEIAGWLPDRCFHLVADGAYATLAGAGLPRTQLTSRMRRDAALYEPAPPRTGRRGRPRTKGGRLPTPTQLSEAVPDKDWTTALADVRGTTRTRLVHTRDVLWYRVNKTDLVRLVIAGDPDATEPDDYFFTTDLSDTPPRSSRVPPPGGPSKSASATSNKTSAPRTPSRGNARDPSAPQPCPCGCTPPPGAGTWIPIPPGRPGHRGPGTAPRPPRVSSTPSPRSAECCGPNELQPCPAPNPTTRKSPRRYSTRSPTPHSRIEECESPLPEKAVLDKFGSIWSQATHGRTRR
jgi:DDE superfamily endonuclease